MATSLKYTQGLFPMDYGPFFNGPAIQPHLHQYPMQSNMPSLFTMDYGQGPFLSDEYDTYRYFTDTASASRILQSQMILPSPVDHGNTVVVYRTRTEKYPLSRGFMMANSNYDDWIDVCFEMKLLNHKVQLSRGVYLHPGIINLTEVKGLVVYVKGHDKTYNILDLKNIWF